MRMPFPVVKPQRPAFTLIELLVAMAIFVLLATIAIGAYRGLSDTDRLRQGTSDVLGSFNKARSAAIHDKLPRGVRFLYNSNENVIDSLVLIGSSPDLDEGLIDISFRDPADNNSGTAYSLGPQSASLQFVWSELVTSGALTNSTIRDYGLRIQIPDGGKWYRINSVVPAGVANPFTGTVNPNSYPYLILAEPYLRGNLTSQSYRLELGPTVLPGSQPVALPQNIAIVPTTPGGAVQSSTPGLLSTIDIMFSESGAPLTGDRSNGDILRLLLADSRDFATTALESGGPSPGYEQRVVTFLASTGQAYASAAGPRNDYFRYAQKGQEAKQ